MYITLQQHLYIFNASFSNNATIFHKNIADQTFYNKPSAARREENIYESQEATKV